MGNNDFAQPLLEVCDVSKDFAVRSKHGKSVVHAVSNISFEVYPGETFGLVGESGCGKTTTGRMISCLTEPTAGAIRFEGKNLFGLRKRQLREIRKELQMVFQDPFASLDPRKTIGQSIEEPLVINGIGDKESRRKLVEELLEVVGLQKSYYSRFPHEFSGGQRQRVGIARAFALKPRLIICDEPVSALDVSVQSQILNLLVKLQEETGVSYIFIAHDLSVVKYVSDWVGVMYLGQLVEVIRSADLFRSAAHPYTQALLSAVPVADPKAAKERIILQGEIPSPANPPTGCYFHTRCPYATEKCRTEAPPVRRDEGRAMVACHYPLH